LLETEPPPAIIETAQMSDSEKYKYTFAAKKQIVGKEQILIVTFFPLKTMIAEFRVFFSKKNFATQRLPERKWSESTLKSLISYWHGSKAAFCANKRSENSIIGFFKADCPAYEAMEHFQQEIRQKQLKARHKIETDKIDAQMKLVGKLPANFDDWVNEVALDFSRYIYYKRQSKRLIVSFCTSCQKHMELCITKKNPHKNIRHNQKGKCPVCKKSVTFKAEGRATVLVDTAAAAIMQKTKTGGFVVRSFYVRKEYKRHYKNPTLSIRELVRDFYNSLELVSYEYTDFKQTNQKRWCRARPVFNLDTACLYMRNLRQVLATTEWKYSGIYELARNIDKFNIHGYLVAYKNYPAYEYLLKLRLYRFVADNISGRNWNYAELNFNGKNFQEVLGISRQQLQQLQRINGTVRHFKLIKSVGDIGITLTDTQLESFLRMNIDRIRLVELLGYITPQKIIGYITHQLEQNLFKEKKYSFQNPATDMAILWSDYLKNCALLGYDLKDSFILYPRDLKKRHDEVMVIYKAKKTELLDKAIAGLYEPLQSRYGFAWQKMLLRPPASMDEIIADGHALHHCAGSGSYIENMAAGKCRILFVRRSDAPDAPFFTMELRDEKVIQCRGNNNCSMTAEVKKFVTQWKKKKL